MARPAAIEPSPGPFGATRRTALRLGREATETVAVTVADEVPVALVYNGLSHAVMMASPIELEAFALGFSLSEGLLQTPDELLDLEVAPASDGYEIRMRVTARRFAGLQDRRRALTGRTGCGLCGVESLEEAVRSLPEVKDDFRVELASIRTALSALPAHQALNRAAGAVHAAAWADPTGKILAVAEDVGRHNALDKLIGLLARDRPPGFLIMTSRCSYELVAKAVTVGMPILVAISAPTGLALDMAERAGLTVIALARHDAVTLYTHPERITGFDEAKE
ncbi:MAG TPA: formate dehydrogenase accessory sulfurtransferase FdhD [Aliidongia sp.]|nr:formate dehydrogenase accessory sulfurtransferase FdhD [Aliidongia sp.]